MMIVGLQRSPRAKNTTPSQYGTQDPGLRAYRAYARTVSMKNTPASRSPRAETQATASARSGCTANTAATNAHLHIASVSSPERKKQQDRGNGVQRDVCEVMATRARAKKLAVRHVRKRGERRPAAHQWVGECPCDARPVQPSVDLRDSKDIFPVVVIDELKSGGLAENQPHKCHQRDADARRDPALAG